MATITPSKSVSITVMTHAAVSRASSASSRVLNQTVSGCSDPADRPTGTDPGPATSHHCPPCIVTVAWTDGVVPPLPVHSCRPSRQPSYASSRFVRHRLCPSLAFLPFSATPPTQRCLFFVWSDALHQTNQRDESTFYLSFLSDFSSLYDNLVPVSLTMIFLHTRHFIVLCRFTTVLIHNSLTFSPPPL